MDSAKREKFVTVRSGVLTEIQKVFLPKIYKKYYYQTWDDNIKILEENNWPSWLHPMCVPSGNNDKIPENVLL